MEEAGIDGGGIFKDFMENITRAAFDVQYGLFKVVNLCYCFSFSSFHIHEWFLSKLVGTYARNFFISIMVKMPVVASLPFSYDSRI